MVLPAIILLIVWSAVAGPVPAQITDTTTTFTISDDCVLSDNGLIALSVLVGWLGVVLIVGAVIAILGRNIPASFNESSYIGFAVLHSSFS